MVSLSGLSKFFEGSADELAALACVGVGLYIFIKKDPQTAMQLISIGTSYLFGKNVPKSSG